MVTEPTASVVQTNTAAFAASILAVTGVSYHGLLWGGLGAVVALMFAAPQDRGKAVASVVGGMLCGAVMSDLIFGVLQVSMSLKEAGGIHLGMAFIIGGGAKQIFAGAISMLESKLTPKDTGGNDEPV